MASDTSGKSAPPGLPSFLNIHDFHASAKSRLSLGAYGYYSSGADDERTLAENVDAFRRYKLRPRVCVDVSRVDTGGRLLGCVTSFPLSIAPSAFHRLADAREGEAATARAALAAGVGFCVSTMATLSMEAIAAVAPAGLRWFQLYVFTDQELTLRLIRRAEAAGYRALVVTVDRPVLGNREIDIRNTFDLPPEFIVPHLEPPDASLAKASTVNVYKGAEITACLSWPDLVWLQSQTRLPLILKGVMTPEDASLAVRAGVAAVWVSNHGARQLDGVDATIDVLAAIVAAVRHADAAEAAFALPPTYSLCTTNRRQAVARAGQHCRRTEVYVDGGIRRGTDIYKCIALGADHVFAGRPILWGLAHGGQAGVAQVLDILRTEFRVCMQLMGVTRVADIHAASIVTSSARAGAQTGVRDRGDHISITPHSRGDTNAPPGVRVTASTASESGASISTVNLSPRL